MIAKLNNITFYVEMLIAAVWFTFLYLCVRQYWTNTREIKDDHLKIPTNNSLIVLGLLIPILVALVSYLYTKNPDGNYSSLLSTIILLFVVLVVAVWETFAIMGLSSRNDKITLTMPKDRKVITGLAVMYGFLILGLVYFSIFFLFEIEAARKQVVEVEKNGYVLLKKTGPRINQTKNELLKSWGSPSAYRDKNREVLEYKGIDSIIYLYFDKEGRLSKIIEFRRKGGGKMNGAKFLDDIKRRIRPEESPEDVVAIINILAEKRAKANNRGVSDEDYSFAAKIICILFPLKPPEYRKEVVALRMKFRGISSDSSLQHKFEKIFSDELLKARTAKEAIGLGFKKLFLHEMGAGA